VVVTAEALCEMIMNAFDYVHAPTCSCHNQDFPRETQLAWARWAETVRLRGLVLAGTEFDSARAKIPDGSCVGWIDGHGDWPVAHRDHHLMARWASVVKLHSEAERVRAIYEAARSAGTLTMDPANESVSVEWGDYLRLHDVLSEAHHALLVALTEAPWGPQPDGSFLTRRSIGVASGRHVHTLHAPASGGPLAEAADSAYTRGKVSSWVVRTRGEARALREEERAQNRARARRYDARRRMAILILRAGGRLPYRSGQRYGVFDVSGPCAELDMCTGGERPTVSAVGVLRGCGFSLAAAQSALPDEDGTFSLADLRECCGGYPVDIDLLAYGS
jgi:hypothetical protein